MLQTVNGKYGYVVEFDEVPKLPVTYSKRKEKPYAQALGIAISQGQLTEPGKYMIVITGDQFEIFNITEPKESNDNEHSHG